MWYTGAKLSCSGDKKFLLHMWYTGDNLSCSGDKKFLLHMWYTLSSRNLIGLLLDLAMTLQTPV
jgi:hypothetical protein